jgi:hypothetical protein
VLSWGALASAETRTACTIDRILAPLFMEGVRAVPIVNNQRHGNKIDPLLATLHARISKRSADSI